MHESLQTQRLDVAQASNFRYDGGVSSGRNSQEKSILEGSVERVTFHNEENGYSVLKVAVQGRREPATVVGNVPEVTVGETLEAEGEWIQSVEFGRQFKATSLRTRPPTSTAGIERFLGSGLIAGIGKTYAKKIVEKFGEDVFNIIENQSARLEEIEGVGKKRRHEIKESWKRQKAVHRIMVFLYEHGISTGRALRIYKTYGEDAEQTLKNDPYQLARDIHGIGFQGADKIAQSLGIPVASNRRVRAGIQHVLEQSSSDGHSGLPREDLSAQSSEVLGVNCDLVETELERLLITGELIADDGLVYLGWLHHAEVMIAERLQELSSGGSTYPEIDSKRALEWVQGEIGIALADGQREAVTAALCEKVLVITGGPGVGKTTVLNSILKILGAKSISPVLAAPTGRAARRMAESTGLEAQTLHRLLEYRPDVGWARDRKRPLKADLLVVDEASMIDLGLMAHVLDALPPACHLILVGDADQLPSVGPGMVLRDIIESEVVPVARLTEIFRQAAASRIVTAAHAINAGKLPELRSPAESDFFFFEREEPEDIRRTLVEVVGHRLPGKFGVDPITDVQVLTPMNRNALGTRALNGLLQEALNPPDPMRWEVDRFGVTYRVRDKVIQNRNNYDKEIFNGDIGKISRIDSEPTQVIVDFEGERRATYEAGELDELDLAYAITIHKSQGSEFPVVVMPVSTQHYMMMQRNLIYTGITRGKRLVVLLGQQRALSMAVENASGGLRHGRLRERLRRWNA